MTSNQLVVKNQLQLTSGLKKVRVANLGKICKIFLFNPCYVSRTK